MSKIFKAIEERDPGAVRELLHAGVPPNCVNKDGYSALAAAAKVGDTSILALLLDAGASQNQACQLRTKLMQSDPRGASVTPLAIACAFDHRGAVELLLDRGANPALCSEGEDTAAHRLFQLHPIDLTPLRAKFIERTLTAMFDKGLSADALGRNGTPLLSLAFDIKAPLSTFKLLLKYGANPSFATDEGHAHVHGAVLSSRADVMRALVASGADVDARYFYGRSALFLCEETEVTRILIAAKANVDLQDEMGNTALHHQLKILKEPASKSDIVAALLEAGASPSIRNHAGQTAMDIVRSRGLTGCAPLVAAAIAREAMRKAGSRASATL